MGDLEIRDVNHLGFFQKIRLKLTLVVLFLDLYKYLFHYPVAIDQVEFEDLFGGIHLFDLIAQHLFGSF